MRISTPNILSISRIFLSFISVALGVAFFSNIVVYTLIILAAGISDFLDGYLARVFNQVSKSGRILDYTCDKIFFSTILIQFSVNEIIPIWLVILNVARDFLVMAYRINIINEEENRLSVYIGKTKTAMTYFILPFYIINVDILYWGLILTTFLAGASLAIILYKYTYGRNF